VNDARESQASKSGHSRRGNLNGGNRGKPGRLSYFCTPDSCLLSSSPIFPVSTDRLGPRSETLGQDPKRFHLLLFPSLIAM